MVVEVTVQVPKKLSEMLCPCALFRDDHDRNMMMLCEALKHASVTPEQGP
jgi:ferredoxin-thioredoxin reductase catalytic subunit